MSPIVEPMVGRQAREAARMRSRALLRRLLDELIAQELPWLVSQSHYEPEHGHHALCTFQKRLVQEARSRAEALILNDMLHDAVDARNRHCIGHEIAPPGAITAVFPQEDSWRLEDIGFYQSACALHAKYTAVVEHSLSLQNTTHQLFGLCLASAIFDSACLNVQDLQLFTEWLLDNKSTLYAHENCLAWADLKERARVGEKPRPLRIASGKDAAGFYRLKRLFIAPRSLQLIAQFWAISATARSSVSARGDLLEAMTFAIGAKPAGLSRLPQILRGAALWVEMSYMEPSHLLISLASRNIKSFAATPETWACALGASGPIAQLKPQFNRSWHKDLEAKAETVSTVLRHSILQSPAYLHFYMAMHDIKEETAQANHVPRQRGRAEMASDIRKAQDQGTWPDVLGLLSDWYLHLLEKEGLRPSSVERYDDTIGLMLCQGIEDLSLKGIAAQDLEDLYIEILESDQRSSAERINLARRLRSLHDFAMNTWSFPEIDREIFAMEGAGLTIRVKASAISHQTFSRALDHLGRDFGLPAEVTQSLQAAFVLSYRGGLRIGEVTKALLSHYETIEGDPDQEQMATLFIRSSRYGSNKTNNALRQIQPMMLLEGEEQALFENWVLYRRGLDPSGPLFGVTQSDGRVFPFERNTIGKVFAEALRLASGLDSLSAHDLRRAALNNIAFALAEQDSPSLADMAQTLTGWSASRRSKIAQMIAAGSRREKWEALARFAGHGSSETTFTHYISHADLLIYHGVLDPYVETASYQEILDLLGKRLIKIDAEAEEYLPAQPNYAPSKVSSPSLLLQVVLGALDRGASLQNAAKAVDLSIARVHGLDQCAQAWAQLTTSRGRPRLRKANAPMRRLPSALPRPQQAEAMELANKLIKLAENAPEKVKTWIFTVLTQASLTNAGVTFREPYKAAAWLEIALQLRPETRWQFDRISPQIDAEERRRLESAWKGIRPAAMPFSTRYVKTGASVRGTLRLLAPNPTQVASSNPAKSWAGCIVVAAHYAAIWLQIQPSEEVKDEP